MRTFKFFGSGPLSQWHQSDFELDGITFVTAEQAKVTDYRFALGLIMTHFDFRVAEFALNRVHSAAMFAQVGFFETCKPVADICFEPS